MRYLSLSEVIALQELVVAQSGGASGIREIGPLLSAVAQPRMKFGGADVYPALEQKGAALCYSLTLNHPFVDGNKRIGHAALETFLLLNGYELEAPVDESEKLMLELAAGNVSRETLVQWIVDRWRPLPGS